MELRELAGNQAMALVFNVALLGLDDLTPMNTVTRPVLLRRAPLQQGFTRHFAPSNTLCAGWMSKSRLLLPAQKPIPR